MKLCHDWTCPLQSSGRKITQNDLYIQDTLFALGSDPPGYEQRGRKIEILKPT